MDESLKKKVFKYKGKTIEELQKFEVREFAKMINSANRRFILRNFQEQENFIKDAKKKMEKGKPMKTHNRVLIVVPQMVGMKIQVYNGQKFVPMEITGEMLGHKIGEFAPTRARIIHTKSGTGGTKGSSVKSRK